MPRECRICKLCTSGEVEDEVHFIFCCGALKETRDTYAESLQFDFDQTASHTIEVKIGRWYNVPRECRICKLCTSGEVEDEVHFIFCCGALKETRDTYAESLQFDFDQTASHTIEVKIGRWYNVPRECRICKLCTSGEVEDEVHFIFCCGALKETRDTYAESLQFDFDQTASHTIEVKIGRWYNVPRECRICKLCTSGEVEDEVHFIFCCGALKETRDTYAESLQFDFDQTASHTINEIESFMTEPKVKQFARFITDMQARSQPARWGGLNLDGWNTRRTPLGHCPRDVINLKNAPTLGHSQAPPPPWTLPV